MRSFFFILLCTIYNLSFSQPTRQLRVIDSMLCQNYVDSMKPIYVNRSHVAEEFENSFYAALAHYPELVETQIRFKKTKISTTLNTRPTFGSMLVRKKHNRTYIIRINQSKKDSIVTFDEIPLNASIGLLGHELMHIKDYRSRGFFGIIGRLFAYGSKKSKARFEKEIDAATIRQSLGWQLYDWSDYVLNQSDGTAKYKRFKQRTYLQPVEIENYIINEFHR